MPGINSWHSSPRFTFLTFRKIQLMRRRKWMPGLLGASMFCFGALCPSAAGPALKSLTFQPIRESNAPRPRQSVRNSGARE